MVWASELGHWWSNKGLPARNSTKPIANVGTNA